MIQRVQSIWLLLAVITLIAMFFLPLLTKDVSGTEYGIYTSGLHHKMEGAAGTGYAVIIDALSISLNALGALLCLVAIFFFRKRSVQKGLIIAGILTIIILTGLCGFGGQQLPGGLTEVSLTAGTFLPVIAVLFCILALRGIRKDEQLLRSADRLR